MSGQTLPASQALEGASEVSLETAGDTGITRPALTAPPGPHGGWVAGRTGGQGCSHRGSGPGASTQERPLQVQQKAGGYSQSHSPGDPESLAQRGWGCTPGCTGAPPLSHRDLACDGLVNRCHYCHSLRSLAIANQWSSASDSVQGTLGHVWGREWLSRLWRGVGGGRNLLSTLRRQGWSSRPNHLA